MSKTSSICSSCYSNRLLKIYKKADIKFQENGQILSEKILPFGRLPNFNSLFVRFNAYGELINLNHTVNLFNIAEKNKDVTFTLWTKRVNLVHKAIEKQGKPKNLILIYSSPKTNIKVKKPKYFNKVFTVFDKPGAQKTTINCKEKCFDCRKCYTLSDRTIYINEMKK